jgi:cobalamin synthase
MSELKRILKCAMVGLAAGMFFDGFEQVNVIWVWPLIGFVFGAIYGWVQDEQTAFKRIFRRAMIGLSAGMLFDGFASPGSALWIWPLVGFVVGAIYGFIHDSKDADREDTH